MKTVTLVCITGLAFSFIKCSPVREQQRSLSQLDRRAHEIKTYAQKKGYSTRYCFLLDMRLQSGLNRFFVYDMLNNKVVYAGLVSHGDCDQNFLKTARYSNAPGSGCTSIGIYKIGRAYYGQYGKAYKLYGLQETNSNAFNRGIVLHGNTFIPEEESYPKAICNSSGCPMVSYSFLKEVSSVIDRSPKPVLLWVYNSPQKPFITVPKLRINWPLKLWRRK